MKVLVTEKLSEHKYKTPEGYLICTDAILARTGKQSYTKDELFQDGDNTEVDVDRPYDEVMNAKTIASAENKPITFDHPDEDVNVGNYKDYAVGYVRDAHQGKTDKGEDVILGNLVITDQDAINAIEQGDHTDLSCGYDCDIRDDGNGNYSQTNIRINHLALCEQGRAGIARIVDSKMEDDETIDYKGIKIGVLHTHSGTLYEVRYNKNKADWPEYKKLENAKKYIDIFLTKGEQAANASWKIDDTIVDSKVKDASKIVYYDPETGAKVLYDYELGYCVKWHNKYSMSSTYDRNRAIKWAKDENWIANETWLSKDEQMFDSIVDSKMEDSLSKKEKELCDYMLENALDDGEDENDLLKKMKVYYSEYSNLARSKPDEVLRYFKSHIDDSKVKDFNYAYELSEGYYVKKIGNENDVVQIKMVGQNDVLYDTFEYSKEWGKQLKLKNQRTPIKIMLSMLEKGYVKKPSYKDSKEMTMSDAIKMLNIVDAYKKVRDAEWKKDNAVYYKFESGYWHVFSIYNRNKLSPENVTKLARQYNVSIASYENESLRKDYDTGVWYYESYVVKGKDKQNVIKFCEKLNPRVAPLKFEDSTKDASKDKWVIKNTGLAYEIWNQGKMVKKLPTKKLAIEWIHSRFPNDEIIEDSIKDADVNFLIKGKKS